MIVTVNKTPTTIFCLFFVFSAFLCSASDTIKWNSFISDLKNETLVSIGRIFELGFFTPNGASHGNNRYVGIWYYSFKPRTVIWVANRNNTVKDPNGTFGIAGDGTLIVSNASGVIFWSIPGKPSSKSLTVKLLDSGNLVFSDDDRPAMSLWESFKDPTDTFLPGMKMNADLSLTSWIRDGDPGIGRFKFNLSQEGGNSYVISKEAVLIEKELVLGKLDSIDEMPSAISYFLSNFTGSFKPRDFNPQLNILRLVMNYTGRLEFMILEVDRWNLIWWGPGNCSTPNFCGSFGSCNNNNRVACKCLPGFKPSNSEKWNSGDFPGGCTRISTCPKTNTFFILRMMKMSDPDDTSSAENETDCRDRCLKSCACQAYSYVAGTNKQGYDDSTITGPCLIWLKVVNDLQEEYKNSSLNLSVRVAKSDIEPTVRSCEPCGTNMIPYPLSTGPNCGEPMYFSFFCNTSNGQVRFNTPSGSYRVTRIDPNARKFVITVRYEGKYGKSTENLQLNKSTPFVTSRTTVYSENPLIQDEDIEIIWEPLQEPICNLSKDCNDWTNSTCKAARDGKRRCLCTTGFQWNGTTGSCTKEDAETISEPLLEPNCNSSNDCKNWTNSICTPARDRKRRCLCTTGFQWNGTTGSCPKEGEASNRNMSLTLIVMTPLIIVFVLVCVIVCIYVWRRKMTKRQEASEKRSRALRTLDSERHLKDLLDSNAFREDEQGIDIPFFDFESILEATNSFSDTNKLGQGGYGPVYKGMFPGGQEIAVKRLSSVSGQGLQEFKNEVVLIAKLQHKNLVRLRGYCIKGEEKILLYEYMRNKSLDLFLFDQSLSKILDWQMRINIILGIARGLLYLHQDSRLKIIHRDLKTSNILLDEEMNPKISDFGLARIVGGKETGANTMRIVGTYGYMSPEYALDGHFSIKSDVFSFGVILLEIISGRKNTGFYQSELALSLIGYLWAESKVLDLMDPALHEDCNADQFVKCVNIGLLCVQENPGDRPTISNVVIMLESETATVPTPKQPAFVPRVDFSSTARSSSRPETNTELSSTFGAK